MVLEIQSVFHLLCLAILGNKIHVSSRRFCVFLFTFTSSETGKREMALDLFAYAYDANDMGGH